VNHNAAGVAQLNQQQGRWQQEEPITLKAPEEEHGNAPDGMQKDGGHLKPVAGEWGVTKSCLRLESLRCTGTDHSNPTGMTDEKRISLSIRQDKRNFLGEHIHQVKNDNVNSANVKNAAAWRILYLMVNLVNHHLLQRNWKDQPVTSQNWLLNL
jgi:hypothetical protein